MNVDLEKPVSRFVNILFAVLLALPMAAQVDSLSVSADTVVVSSPVPTIEYTMQRKTYEIADIAVTGADSYEDFVLIGFSGLAVGDRIEKKNKKRNNRIIYRSNNTMFRNYMYRKIKKKKKSIK